MDAIAVDSPIYLAINETDCWECKSEMKVVAIITSGFIENLEGVKILSNVTQLPDFLLEQIQKLNPHYQLRYSKMGDSKYYANICPQCGVISGDYFLHSEPGEAFFPTNDEEVRNICLKKIEFDEKIEIESSYGIGLGEYILANGKYV